MVRIRWVTDDVIARAIGGSLLATFVAAVVWTFVAVPQQHRRAAPSESDRSVPAPVPTVPSTTGSMFPDREVQRQQERELEAVSRAIADGLKRASSAVRSHPNTQLGPILVDRRGMTLYTLTNAAGGELACTGDCSTRWQPLPVPEIRDPDPIVIPVSDIGTRSYGDGRMVITHKSAVLYLFAGDYRPGDTNGEGVAEGRDGTAHAVRIG
jgi:predicted lipoprotein with Yx(FWY)xxD motif